MEHYTDTALTDNHRTVHGLRARSTCSCGLCGHAEIQKKNHSISVVLQYGDIEKTKNIYFFLFCEIDTKMNVKINVINKTS